MTLSTTFFIVENSLLNDRLSMIQLEVSVPISYIDYFL